MTITELTSSLLEAQESSKVELLGKMLSLMNERRKALVDLQIKELVLFDGMLREIKEAAETELGAQRSKVSSLISDFEYAFTGKRTEVKPGAAGEIEPSCFVDGEDFEPGELEAVNDETAESSEEPEVSDNAAPAAVNDPQPQADQPAAAPVPTGSDDAEKALKVLQQGEFLLNGQAS